MKVSMKHIADRLNISINAVSLALNSKPGVSEKTRKKVLNTAEELGYLEQSQKFVKTFASRNICTIIKKSYVEDHYFYSKIMMGISEESRKNGYDIITCLIDKNEQQVPSCVQNKKVSGIIVIGIIEDDYLIKLKKFGMPVILVDHTSLIESTDSILTDNKLGGFKITKLLFEKGYKNIGFFGDLDYSLSIKERYFGYKEALKKLIHFSNIEERHEYIDKHCILSDLEEYVINQDYKMIEKKIMSLKKMPEAFVCSNDNAAICLIRAFKDMGYSVPVDVSVVGFDDIALSSLVVPRITTVRVEKELMGKKSIERLIWRLEHKKEPIENIVMSVEIINRDSIKNKSM